MKSINSENNMTDRHSSEKLKVMLTKYSAVYCNVYTTI